MTRVYKYILDPAVSTVTLPVDAEILHVSDQHGDLCLWARVDPTITATEKHRINIVGTGHPIDDEQYGFKWKHLGTSLLHGGSLVLHVFVEQPITPPRKFS